MVHGRIYHFNINENRLLRSPKTLVINIDHRMNSPDVQLKQIHLLRHITVTTDTGVKIK